MSIELESRCGWHVRAYAMAPKLTPYILLHLPRYTFISESTRASVVPFQHDEYPRFITGAWPFYFSAISVTATFLLFCSLWVWTSDGKQDVKGAKGLKGKKTE